MEHSLSRTHRRFGQQALPGRDDVRCLGQPPTMTSRSASSTVPGCRDQLVDTADVYAQGESEENRRQGAAGRRDDIILDQVPRRDGRGPQPTGQLAALDHSRSRGLAAAAGHRWIDLYQVHRPARRTDVEETLSALTDPRPPGQDRCIGSSTFPASQIVEAQWVARDRHLQRFVHRASAVLDPGAGRRGRRATHLRTLRHGRHVL